MGQPRNTKCLDETKQTGRKSSPAKMDGDKSVIQAGVKSVIPAEVKSVILAGVSRLVHPLMTHLSRVAPSNGSHFLSSRWLTRIVENDQRSSAVPVTAADSPVHQATTNLVSIVLHSPERGKELSNVRKNPSKYLVQEQKRQSVDCDLYTV